MLKELSAVDGHKCVCDVLGKSPYPFASDDDHGHAVTRELSLYPHHFAHEFQNQRRCRLAELHHLRTHHQLSGHDSPLLPST